METAPERLERILKENNLNLFSQPLRSETVSNGSILINPPQYQVNFIDPSKEKKDEPIPSQTAEKTNGKATE